MLHLDPPMLGEDVRSGLPVLIVAMEMSPSGMTYFLTIDMDGRYKTVAENLVLADYRWSQAKGWHDNTEAQPPTPPPPAPDV